MLLLFKPLIIFLTIIRRVIMSNKSSFGQKLKQIRKSKNLTQEKLAELSDVNEKHISKIETGVYFPTYTTLTKILKALDLSIEDVGLNLEQVESKDSPFYIKSLQILNGANNEQELEYFYNLLRAGLKNIDVLKND